MFSLSVCVAEDSANRAREQKKRFRSRQTASKQGTNHTVKLQIFVRYPFSYFSLETGSYKLIFVLRGPQNKITLKFDGLETKINFHLVLIFALFSKVRKYEIKYRTKICDFTVLVIRTADGSTCPAATRLLGKPGLLHTSHCVYFCVGRCACVRAV